MNTGEETLREIKGNGAQLQVRKKGEGPISQGNRNLSQLKGKKVSKREQLKGEKEPSLRCYKKREE